MSDAEGTVAVDDEEQCSVFWETSKPLPRGWFAAGTPGARGEYFD